MTYMMETQVDRYKQLLMKQRDIMIALTQRLNERDDAVRCDGAGVGKLAQNQSVAKR